LTYRELFTYHRYCSKLSNSQPSGLHYKASKFDIRNRRQVGLYAVYYNAGKPQADCRQRMSFSFRPTHFACLRAYLRLEL